jgi:hypothetical protein
MRSSVSLCLLPLPLREGIEGRGRFSARAIPNSVRPECPRSGCIEGPWRNSDTSAHALARSLYPPLRLACAFRLRRVTSCLQRQEVTKKRRPGVCARLRRVPCASRPRRVSSTGHPWPVDEICGIHALPGANTRAGRDAAGCDARRSQTGVNVNCRGATAKSKATKGYAG